MAWWWYIIDDPLAGILFATILLAISGVPGLLIEKPGWGQRLAATIAVTGSLIGLGNTGRMMAAGSAPALYIVDLGLPFGAGELSADPLSTLFLIPLFLVTGCCALYATAYWPAHKNPASEKKLTFFFGILPSAMAMVLLVRHGVLLLISWEIMALAAYFLLTTDQRDSQVQRAGIIYLLATHTGTMALYILFALLRHQTGAFAFPLAHTLSPESLPTAILLLAALIGFGAKAGIMPMHIWLPGAHANAPSHVSAMMSGLMLKVGVYGILRTITFFSVIPAWFGAVVLLLGAVSALTGIALAAAQTDLKRLLAYSSIENIGIIFIGLGMALIGMQTGTPALIILGLVGCFMHIINHGIFKPLLFLGAGVLIHATGTREIDRMGGLARQLPQTTPFFLAGSLAISGLPPLNGFVGELFIYFAAFTEALTSPIPVLALIAPLLAIVGGLAVITFVKLFGTIFLGSPRTPEAARAHEAPLAMVAPLGMLALLCLAIGISGPLLLRLVEPAVIFYGMTSPAGFSQIDGGVPLATISVVNAGLILLALLVALVYLTMIGRLPKSTTTTWGCGYLALSPRIQYTGTSFSELTVRMLGVVIAPHYEQPRIKGKLPQASRFGYSVTDTIVERFLTPFFENVGRAFSFLRRLQHGQVHLYMLYIFATLFVLMVWVH